ncbi:universal stress protein [Streptomyces sp. NPDC047002]|uniref:universal stress protein n=1 Tax=Streptomyces sp. NPDC047002 TaxID=3155475 RepID=UPI0034544AC9
MGSGTPQERRVVVGVDGSPSSKEALRWAVSQAKDTGAVVEAVIAWDVPVTGWPAAVPSRQFAAWAAGTLDETVEDVLGAEVPVTVRRAARGGHPAKVLVDAARGADLLVVGSRGHGGFAGALLGSVGLHCARHAPCPVVVVRAAAGDGGA